MSGRGQIQLILGPMFSGKTTELIRRIKRYETANHKCMVVKYSKDVRYDEGENFSNSIATHDRNRINATEKATILRDVQDLAANYSVIGIDEGQYLYCLNKFKDVKEFSEKMANAGKIIIVAALDGTYQRKAFGDILELVPLAESIIKLSAVCMKCYSDASFTKRITCDIQVELIGGKESYLAVCRECFHEKNTDEICNESTKDKFIKTNEKKFQQNKENMITETTNKILSIKNY